MSEYLTTHELAGLLHVSPATVRRWADSGLLPAIRTAGGHRRFSREVAERIARQPATGGGEEVDRWVDLLVSPGAMMDVDAALLSERHQRGSWHAVATALGRVLERLGDRWERNELTVVQEHLAAARLERSLARLAEALPVRLGGPRALLFTPEGEGHTLGLSLVELVLREWGWPTLFVGREAPVRHVLSYLPVGGVGAVLVSASIYSRAETLRAFVDEFAPACAAAAVPLVVGGRGPWPEHLPSGEVIREFRGLRDHLAKLDLARAG
ncbi:MAG TPA: helix-turn-helix domain-containing protein [Anaeromyxobacteraceae bacterium]|nr:helix-turn-helix domain-containing protein [Anaeromyxobacteraceae bacterium]